MEKTCEIGNEDCNQYRAAGLCRYHYWRKKNGGPVYEPKWGTYQVKCGHEGCDRKCLKKGHCAVHRSQFLNWGVTWDIGGGAKAKEAALAAAGVVGHVKRDGQCPILNCSSMSVYSGVCQGHTTMARIYGIGVERLVAMFDNTQGVCEICQDKMLIGRNSDMKFPAIDHDHSCCPRGGSCGKCVRGIICQACNIAAGYVKDSPEVATRLAAYLSR